MEGWIKLERAIQDHWIFEDPIKLKWWIIILLHVNHTEKKVNIGNKIFIVKRGESVRSLSNWAELFKTDKSSVRRYFELLKTDTMIDTRNEHKTTRLTICNYESYVVDKNADETQMKRKRNGNETHSTPNNNDNNENNDKNEKKIDFGVLGDDFNSNWNEWVNFRIKLKKKFVDIDAQQKGVNQLISLSKGNKAMAIEIINKSIANSWQGLFALPVQETNNTYVQKRVL